MMLALDVGNSQIFGGVFQDGALTTRFRKPSHPSTSSDELGVFLRSVLRENGCNPAAVSRIAVCCVVPELIHAVQNCCRKYFKVDPFLLRAGVKTGLKIRYRNPVDVGPDRIANAIAATHLHPGRHVIVIDFGTATTIDAVRADREFLGGVILPGLRISMEALEQNTSRLPSVEIIRAPHLIGRSTVEGIQSGLYFGNRAIVRELTRDIRADAFGSEPAVVIGTGGFSRLFDDDQTFDVIERDLILIGLERALALNDLEGPGSGIAGPRAVHGGT